MASETTRGIASAALAVMMVSISFGIIASDNAQAAFIQNLSNTGLPSTFVAYDTAWNEAGTMAVVVGREAAALSTNAYAYYPNNDTYWPIDNGGSNSQYLHAVDYFSQPIYDWPKVLLVDADCSPDGLIDYYSDLFNGIDAYVDTWQVWQWSDPSYLVQGKPTAADMESYDLVVWIPSRDMYGMDTPGDALNPTDMIEIGEYLDGGGNFFISNMDLLTYWNTFLDPGEFIHDYLGVNGYGNTNSEAFVRPIASDAVFGDMMIGGQDWNYYGWTGSYSGTRILWAGLGTYCFEGGDATQSFWIQTGVRYNSGAFKTVFLGFPLETTSINYGSELMQDMLDWISQISPDQSHEYMGNYGEIQLSTFPNNLWAQSFKPTQTSISAVEFYMRSNVASGDSFTIQIRNDDMGQPGTTLVTGTIPSYAIPTSLEWVRCDFPAGTDLTPAVTYWIVCSVSGNPSNHYWVADWDQTYYNGIAEMHDGIYWSGALSYDWLFRTYSGTTAPNTKVMTLYPTKDNTIYSEFPSNSNGAGQNIIVGTDYYPHYRRGLLEFDIAGSIPKYSTINSANLIMYCNYNYNNNGYDTYLLPLTNEWGEAGSDAPDIEETGTSAQVGDVTWNSRFYNTEAWMAPGGEYDASVASTYVGSSGSSYSWSSSDMAANAQGWLDEPGSNHGWIMIGYEGTSNTAKWFNSKDSNDEMYWPRLTITYAEPTIIGYEDVFWVVGDNSGPNTIYKVVPSNGMALIPMNGALNTQDLYAIAVDDMGNPLCGGQSSDWTYYFDGNGWIQQSSGSFDVAIIEDIEFNPDDRRFYLTGYNTLAARPIFYYTAQVPLYEPNACYEFLTPGLTMDCSIRAIAWNHNYNYGLAVGDEGLIIKVWPYANDELLDYDVIESDYMNYYRDVSWDSDEWEEAGIVGTYSTSKMYWRFYNSNPQILEGYNGLAGSYNTCGFKPPSSPKWLFIPSGAGSIRVNTEEKDQSGEITVSSEFPHIFQLGMWKQSDPGKLSTLNTQVEADSTYTFFVEANYTRSGADYWDTSLGIYFQGWHDAGLTGTNSNPGDTTWSSATHRTRQFNISYMPFASAAAVSYPDTGLGVSEFALHSYWEDPTAYGTDGFSHRIYINVTLGKQTAAASGDGVWGSTTSWDKNVGLDDMNTWDLKVLLSDTGVPEAFNASYAEFGVKRYGSLSVAGNPSGSIPPGGSSVLATPSRITYSSNLAYQINVSIPNLLKDGDPTKFIPATSVWVLNDQIDADAFNSDISVSTAFTAPNDGWCVWGIEGGSFLAPPSSGTVSAGPIYTDYTAAVASEIFQPTPVYWEVFVPAGTPEGVYRATITVTLWS